MTTISYDQKRFLNNTFENLQGPMPYLGSTMDVPVQGVPLMAAFQQGGARELSSPVPRGLGCRYEERYL